jgi:histidine triad (HIT) family protein
VADCIFCRIVAKQIPAKVVHEDADVIAFEDLNPQAPTHVLVIPRKHVPTLNDLVEEDDALLGKLHRTGAAIAKARGFAGSGWRAVMNVNRDAGQTVFHVHLHVLGGKPMGWPPFPAA